MATNTQMDEQILRGRNEIAKFLRMSTKVFDMVVDEGLPVWRRRGQSTLITTKRMCLEYIEAKARK